MESGQLLLTVTKRPRSRDSVPHPDQFRTVLPAAAWPQAREPLAHQVPADEVSTVLRNVQHSDSILFDTEKQDLVFEHYH